MSAATQGADVPVAANELGFRLNFFKLIVSDMQTAVDFYAAGFGMVEAGARIDLPEIEEAMLTMPGDRFTLVLYRWKDGRTLDIGTAHGPVGFLTRNVDAAHDRLIEHGAKSLRRPFVMGPMKIAFVADPEGHEIELIQYIRD